MASFKDAVKLYTKLALVGGAGGYAYLHHKCKTTKEEAMDWELT